MMFASASGVLKQRASPNARCSPNVMPNTPPLPGHLVDDVRVGVGDVFAEHADAFVARHLLVQREPDRFAERDDVGVGRDLGLARIVGDRGIGPTTLIDADARVGPRRRERLLGRGAHGLLALRRGSASACSAVSTPASTSCLLEHDDRIVLGFVLRARSAPRYFFWSSESECEYGRVTSAWTRHGPAPARTCAIASAPLRRTSK